MHNILLSMLLIAVAAPALADQHVNGYTRSNGTYVNGYERSSPNSTRLDNYSTKGNTNPYTGQQGSVNPYNSQPAQNNNNQYNQYNKN